VFSSDDTIVAIATPQGRGGIGVVRLSGPDAERIACAMANRADSFAPRYATYVRLADDQVLITSFPAPQSYTGEHVVEISAHGAPVVLDAILRRAIADGARLAEPGEFTLRAFLHGKLDLIQAEAVGDLIDAVTPLQARAAFDQLEGTLTTAIGAIEQELFELVARLEASLDFPDEGYHFIGPGSVASAIDHIVKRVDDLLESAARGRMIREGARVAIVGAPNVGKSSLFNALLNANRAIVTPVAGTTRDLLTERADIHGLSIALVDTAGMRESVDIVEQEGVSRARGAASAADLLLVVLDRSRPLTPDDEEVLRRTPPRRRIIVFNKCDLAASEAGQHLAECEGRIEVSATTGAGLSVLAKAIAARLGADSSERDQPRVTNVRHATLLTRAREALVRASDAVSASNGTIAEEFLLADLQLAAASLQEVSGKRSPEDLLRHIFERFCIGK
jgi:tRNA modification GTPase